MSIRWYPHDIEAYEKKTKGLTMRQDGAYHRLLVHYYRTESPLPISVEEVHRIAVAMNKGERDDVEVVLRRFFKLQPDGWHNKRADEELVRAFQITEVRRSAGAKGGRPRKEKSNSKANGSANGYSELCTADPLANTPTVTSTELEPEGSNSKTLFVLPDWVPKPEWDAFMEVRKRAKASPTDRAKALLVLSLEKLMEQGFTAHDIINASIENSWKGFYPPPQRKHLNGSGNGTQRPSATDQHLAGIHSLIGDLRAQRK